MYKQYLEQQHRASTEANLHSHASKNAAEFQDKVVIITGASSGIGQLAALEYVKHGAKVAIVARSKENLAETERRCAEVTNSEHVLKIAADVTNFDDLNRIVEETVRTFGKIDILVNNAGRSNTESLTTSTIEGYDEIMNLNARAPFFLIQRCVPYLAETKGNIVNISSGTSLRGRAVMTVYSMAKAAVSQLTRAACSELAPKGIRVNTVTPGMIETNFFAASGVDKMISPAMKDFTEKAPMHRLGQAEDVVACVLFLSSSKASFIDGADLIADGGRYCI